MAEKISKAGKRTIAVVDFVDLQGNVTELGRFLAEEFSSNLADAGKGFEVVDRTHLKTLLKEHKLTETGVIDPSTAKKLGQIAGVDALVTGTITPFGDSVRLSVKILGIATAKVVGASSCDIAKTKAIEELLGKEISASPPDTGDRPRPKQKVRVRDFTFELLGAKTDGTNVACDLLITNNASADRDLQMLLSFLSQPLSFIVDNFGNKHGTIEMLLGSQSSHMYDKVSQLLVSGVPTKAKVISGISSKAMSIALLEILISAEGQRAKVQFRNIPLSK